MGVEGVRLRRRHRTTVPDPAAASAPDLIGRDFTATSPDTKYVGDITYLRLADGKFCYLAPVIDLASRRLAGWKTPAEVFEEQLRSLQQPGVASTG
nr:hypothetical protein OG461_34180 [Streptomyces sp. NBC_00995]